LRKRIFRQMAGLVTLGILLVSVVLCILFYHRLSSQACADLQERAQMFEKDDSGRAFHYLRQVRPEDMRVSLISQKGVVLFDNMVRSGNLGDHLDREEIEEALSMGHGESRRFSDTLGTETYYYAIRLSDDSVLRTAKTIHSIGGMFSDILPGTAAVVLLFILIGYFTSRRLAQRVVEPINQVDLSADPPDVPYDELASFARAIAEYRSQIEQDSRQLKKRTDTIQAIMDQMEEGVVLFDLRGTILSVNKSASRIFHTDDTAEGKSALELLRDMEFSGKLRQALQGHRGEMIHRREEKEYRVLISPVPQIGVAVFFLNITEKSQAEKMRREFSANVSHELRTPLTSIYGNVEMLSAGMVREEDKPLFYGKIMGEASRLITLIEDIMMLSRLDEGKPGDGEFQEEVDLAEVASECADTLKQKAIDHQVTMKVAGSDIIMTANRALIYEMFYNLMDNGIKYNKAGGRVRVCITRTKKDTVITVSDTGIGISAGDQDRIFERFYRADKSRSKKSGGTGLGLAIVKHIVLAHGGRIGVSGKPGEGTQFEIVFPG